MSRSNIVFIFLLLILFSNLVVAEEFDIGVSAYKNGNYLKAKTIFSALAQQGHVPSQVLLGEIYDKGRGGPRNYEKAVYWYRLAAIKKDPKAQYYLGVKYFNGHSVPKNDLIAYAWFAVALDNGFVKAAEPLKILNGTLSSQERQQALQMASGKLSALTHVKSQTDKSREE